jgi:DNA-binding response OmpR family regulator
MNQQQPRLLIVESDILVRHALAEYLRECGYVVVEAANGNEARGLLGSPDLTIDLVLADANAPDESGFVLRAWIVTNCPGVEVFLAGTVETAAATAGDLCEQERPSITKPYDHQLVLQRIRQRQGARDRSH